MFFFLLQTACSYGQSKTEQISKLVSTYSEYGRFQGAVLVADDSGILYKEGFGWANVEWEVPNTSDTKFRLASITKQFTALLIVQLVAEEKLALDAPISTYLPDFPKEKGDRITIHHLLTHTSGIPNYTSFPNYRDIMPRHHKVQDLVALFADSTLNFTPGERWDYSNSAYVLLGDIIERATGQTYEQVLQEKIFKPLGMTNSGYDHNQNVLKKRAAGYYVNGRTFTNANYIDMSIPFSAGAIYSTVEDLYLWDRALYTNQLLPKAYRDLLFEKHVPLGRIHYGYGWDLGQMPVGSSEERLPATSHSGGINGFNTLITRIPSDQSFIVLLSNTGHAPLFEMTIAINGILHGKPYAPPKKSLAHDLLGWVEKQGVSQAKARYQTAKKTDEYYLDENEMNLVGYELLQSKQMEAAAAVFELNIEAHPNSFNTYDSYAEALLALGKKDEAIENYLRSVRMNPGNENGLRVLQDLGVATDQLFEPVSLAHLQLLAGEYLAVQAAHEKRKEWKIQIEEKDGELYGIDRGYRYKLVSVGEDKFINPDDGASFQFDTTSKSAISLVLFEKYTFKKLH